MTLSDDPVKLCWWCNSPSGNNSLCPSCQTSANNQAKSSSTYYESEYYKKENLQEQLKNAKKEIRQLKTKIKKA